MAPTVTSSNLVSHGQQAGRLAAREMFLTASPETGGYQGVMSRLGLVGNILAGQHRQDGMSASDARTWRLGFQAGVGLETAAQFRKAQRAPSPSP